jgi:hypothetical protein
MGQTVNTMGHSVNLDVYWTNCKHLRSIYTWVRFRIRLAHFPKYKNNYILKNGLAYCEIALRNRMCKQAFTGQILAMRQTVDVKGTNCRMFIIQTLDVHGTN